MGLGMRWSGRECGELAAKVHRLVVVPGGVAPSGTCASYVLRLRRVPKPKPGGRRCGCRWPSARRSRAGSRRRVVRAIGRPAGPRAVDDLAEVKANGGRRLSGVAGGQAALRRARRPKPAKLARCPRLRGGGGQARARWSPQQIAGWLALDYPDEPEMRVSHETIYMSLFVQVAGRAAQGADALPAHGRRISRPPRQHADDRAGAAPRHGASSASARRGRGPRRARPLGRRPDARASGDSRDRHAGRAPDPLRDALRAARRPQRRAGRAPRSPRKICDPARRSCAAR